VDEADADGTRGPRSRYADRGILVDADEDRWAWRARIKRNPATRRLYRYAVGVVGVLLIILAILTGWLPGPGGVPLALIGLAVLASEFEWAARLLDRVKEWALAGAGWVRRQPTWLRRLGEVITVVSMVASVYVYLLMSGVPAWLPASAEDALRGLPGVD
jgi:hypothetical protein